MKDLKAIDSTGFWKAPSDPRAVRAPKSATTFSDPFDLHPRCEKYSVFTWHHDKPTNPLLLAGTAGLGT